MLGQAPRIIPISRAVGILQYRLDGVGLHELNEALVRYALSETDASQLMALIGPDHVQHEALIETCRMVILETVPSRPRVQSGAGIMTSCRYYPLTYDAFAVAVTPEEAAMMSHLAEGIRVSEDGAPLCVQFYVPTEVRTLEQELSGSAIEVTCLKGMVMSVIEGRPWTVPLDTPRLEWLHYEAMKRLMELLAPLVHLVRGRETKYRVEFKMIDSQHFAVVVIRDTEPPF